MNEKYVKILKKLVIKAKRHNEVPVAAIIVKNNKVIAKAYNKVEKKHNILKHAELIAIDKASKKLKNWRLYNCTMYVTLEPCDMCKAAILTARLKKVVYLTKSNNEISNNTELCFKKTNEESFFLNILKDFFKNKRNNKRNN